MELFILAILLFILIGVFVVLASPTSTSTSSSTTRIRNSSRANQNSNQQQTDSSVKVNWDSSQTIYTSTNSSLDASKLLKDEQFQNRMESMLRTQRCGELSYYYTCQRLRKGSDGFGALSVDVNSARRFGGTDYAVFFLLGAIESGDAEIIEKFKKRYITYPDLLSVVRQMEIEVARLGIGRDIAVYVKSGIRPPMADFTIAPDIFLTDYDLRYRDLQFTMIDLIGKTEQEIMQDIQKFLYYYFVTLCGSDKDSYSEDNWCISKSSCKFFEELNTHLKDKNPGKDFLLTSIVKTVNTLPEVVSFFEKYGKEVDRYGKPKGVVNIY